MCQSNAPRGNDLTPPSATNRARGTRYLTTGPLHRGPPQSDDRRVKFSRRKASPGPRPAVIAPGPKPGPPDVPWSSALGDEPWHFASDAVSCPHTERSAAAQLKSSYGGEEHICLDCALYALERGFPDAQPLWFRDLIRSHYDRPGLHLWFALMGGRSFHCECPCGDRSLSDREGAGIAVDRLICRTCLQDGHIVETQAPVSGPQGRTSAEP